MFHITFQKEYIPLLEKKNGKSFGDEIPYLLKTEDISKVTEMMPLSGRRTAIHSPSIP